MHFEFDPRKSESNKAKHGIDFVEAQELWKSEIALLSAKDTSEKRYIVIGIVGSDTGQPLSPIAAERFGLLGVRRATERETETYEKIAS